jgi:hypothetical protein
VRFLTWCGCVTVALAGLELSLPAGDGWRWVWVALLVFYAFAGLGLVVARLFKAVAGRGGLGALRPVSGDPTQRPTSTPQQK